MMQPDSNPDLSPTSGSASTLGLMATTTSPWGSTVQPDSNRATRPPRAWDPPPLMAECQDPPRHTEGVSQVPSVCFQGFAEGDVPRT